MRFATLGLLAAVTFAPMAIAKDHKDCKCDTTCQTACHDKTAGHECNCKCGCHEGKTCAKCHKKAEETKK